MNDDDASKKSNHPAGSDKAKQDLLAELRAKTAELASKVDGKEEMRKRVLEIDTLHVDGDGNLTEGKSVISQTIEPQSSQTPESTANNSTPAADFVRNKINRLYANEPNAKIEAEEVEQVEETHGRMSKHQKFMLELTSSGKSLADIQTEWHKYYVNLPDKEKHEVWQEFYENQSRAEEHEAAHQRKAAHPKPSPKPDPKPEPKHHAKPKAEPAHPASTKTVAEIKHRIANKATGGGKLTAKQHAKSLLFGLGTSGVALVMIVLLFFNQVFIAPFISPSRSVSATPIIGNTDTKVGPESKVIIPKINLDVPVVFDMKTVDEEAIQSQLENGVVHYASTPNPGESGNSAIVGHSSNNIFNSGKYKFAFVLLKKLKIGDTFYVQRNSVRYTYKVYKMDIVKPEAVDVLSTQDKPNTMTLITCDPPGTSINRLVVVGEQISPNPSSNAASSAIDVNQAQSQPLPSNAPSLWSRIWPF